MRLGDKQSMFEKLLNTKAKTINEYCMTQINAVEEMDSLIGLCEVLEPRIDDLFHLSTLILISFIHCKLGVLEIIFHPKKWTDDCTDILAPLLCYALDGQPTSARKSTIPTGVSGCYEVLFGNGTGETSTHRRPIRISRGVDFACALIFLYSGTRFIHRIGGYVKDRRLCDR
ncbi:hypothetical protein QTP88_023481 [Uroleucon formosanum]